MKLVYASSPAYDSLKQEIFLPSLQESWELIELRFEPGTDGSHEAPEWREVSLQRTVRMSEILQRHPGELMIFCDVDTQWCRPVQPLLRPVFDAWDLLFLRDSPDVVTVNFSLIAARATPKIIKFFAEVAAAAQRGIRDQDFVRNIIETGGDMCRYTVLPSTFFNGPPSATMPQPGWLASYHSPALPSNDGRESLDLKRKMHELVRERMRRAEDVNASPVVATSRNDSKVRVIPGNRPYTPPIN